jgi:hypothetical protein
VAWALLAALSDLQHESRAKSKAEGLEKLSLWPV